MFNRSITYRVLLRIVGMLLLIVALYFAFRMATVPVYENGNPTRYLITVSFMVTYIGIIQQGILLYVAPGLLLLGLSSHSARIAYWSLQIAIWLVGITVWYQQSTVFDPFPPDLWPWFILTMICSLVLFGVYKPIMHLLMWLMGLKSESVNEGVHTAN